MAGMSSRERDADGEVDDELRLAAVLAVLALRRIDSAPAAVTDEVSGGSARPRRDADVAPPGTSTVGHALARWRDRRLAALVARPSEDVRSARATRMR
jgi:hypothetical protein